MWQRLQRDRGLGTDVRYERVAPGFFRSAGDSFNFAWLVERKEDVATPHKAEVVRRIESGLLLDDHPRTHHVNVEARCLVKRGGIEIGTESHRVELPPACLVVPVRANRMRDVAEDFPNRFSELVGNR